MNNLRSLALIVVALGSSTLAGCRHAPSGPMSLPLHWAASAEDLTVFPAAGVEVLRRRAIAVEPFTDARDRRDAVGSNVEQGGAVPVTTPDDVPKFLAGRFAEVLSANGVHPVASGPDRVIHTEVQRFFVIESGLYNGDVALGITVTDGSGVVLWHGVSEGRSKRFGRSFSAENYQEALSSAAVEALKNLGETPDFFNAFK